MIRAGPEHSCAAGADRGAQEISDGSKAKKRNGAKIAPSKRRNKLREVAWVRP